VQWERHADGSEVVGEDAMLRRWIAGAIVLGAAAPVPAQALGTVSLPKAVIANGKLLPAETYQVRLTGDAPAPGAGQSPRGEQWVEFIKSGAVAGRELATVIPASEIGAIAKSPAPRVNGARVDVLKGDEYVLIWINRGTEYYIIHLPPSRN
jgi:hypothetical protein